MPKAPSQVARVFAIVFRVVLLTALFAALGMGLGLFAGIMGSIVLSLVKHRDIDMTLAYRSVAIPMSVLFGAVALIYNVSRAFRTAGRTHA